MKRAARGRGGVDVGADREGSRDDPAGERWSTLLVPVWLGLFLGAWWSVDRFLVVARRALRGAGVLQDGAATLSGARDVVAPVLGLLLATYAIALLGTLRRRARGEPACGEEEDSDPPAPLIRTGALRRHADDIGCGGIVFILVAATVALPFAGQLISSVTGFAPSGRLGVLLWLALAYGGFCARSVWKWARDASR